MGEIISLEDNLKLVYESAANQILNYTPQLYIKSSKYRNSVKPFGSSVLFSKNDNYYLLTAAHCIKQTKDLIKIGVMISRHFYYIKGFVGMAPGRKNEIDIAVIKLEKATAEILAQTYRYLTERDIMPNASIKEETEYLIVGYPNSKTFVNLTKKKISYEPLVYVAKSKSESVYIKMGIDNAINTLVSYNRRKSSFVGEGEMNISPVPDGISGCGLWYVTSYFTVDPIYKLVGIMTEHYGRTNIMMATKIELVMRMVELVH